MAVALVVAGNRILASDINQFYNLLKGVAASGETVTLIYNAAGSLIFQPSSDPAANTQAVQIKNNAGSVQSALTYDGNAILATYLSIGTNPAAAGSIRFANNTNITARNALNTQDITALFVFTDNKVYVGSASNDSGTVIRSAVDVWLSPAGGVDYRYAATGLGGGAAPTLGTIGGSGPGTAGQNSWLQVKINGTNSWLPVWR